MVKNVYSVQDTKAACYANPFYMSCDPEAIRAFGDAASDQKSMLAKHPEDYRLYRIGVFDDNAGTLTPLDVPFYLATASDFRVNG